MRTAIAATHLHRHGLLAGFWYDVEIESKGVPRGPQKMEKDGVAKLARQAKPAMLRGLTAGHREARRIDVSGSQTGVDELHRYGYEALQLIRLEFVTISVTTMVLLEFRQSPI